MIKKWFYLKFISFYFDKRYHAYITNSLYFYVMNKMIYRYYQMLVLLYIFSTWIESGLNK